MAKAAKRKYAPSASKDVKSEMQEALLLGYTFLGYPMFV
jgi:hypothetical protein